MREMDNGGSPSDRERFGWILGRPTEKIINADGSYTVISEGIVLASDEGAADLTIREFEKDTGAKILKKDDQEPRGKDRLFFGFSGRWNAPWEPEGPKPNWKTNPPRNPSLN